MKLLINQIKLDALSINDEFEALINKISKVYHINKNDIINLDIAKKSIDARKKPDIYYIYNAVIEVKESLNKALLKNKDISVYESKEYHFPYSNSGTELRPVIIGSGPAGLFCGYFLSLNGYKPIIIERGSNVTERINKVNNFWDIGELDEECNVQFGEGGAGTFSDGKLNTGVKDKSGRISEVLKVFVRNGAPEKIIYTNKPHIGTDILTDVVKNMRECIRSNGGDVIFDTKLKDIKIDNNKITGVVIEDKNGTCEIINTSLVVLAIGHSARDTFYMLNKNGVVMENKPFAVGYRVSHRQEIIDNNQYGQINSKLPPSDYKVTYKAKSGRGVYSFCMCPGGYVVNSSSYKGKLTVNGMSYSGRDSLNANSAIVMTVDENDYGNALFDGVKFQENIENAAFLKGDGKLVFQTFSDFKNNKESNDAGNVKPVCKGQYIMGNERKIFPENFENDFIEAIEYFENIIPGFNADDVLICGVESRTSSPVKILRDENYECNIKGIYPCGEGAGYAGGITSAAVDGIKVAEQIAKVLNLS